MGFDRWLIHRCTIERPVVTRDAHNHDVLRWPETPVCTDQPCRLVIKEQRQQTDLGELLVVTVYTLLLPATTDVRQGDRITNVVLEDGSRDHGSYRLKSVLPRRAATLRHVSARLERV